MTFGFLTIFSLRSPCGGKSVPTLQPWRKRLVSKSSTFAGRTSAVENHHRFEGFNFLPEEGAALFRTLPRGEFSIRGFPAKDLRSFSPTRIPSDDPLAQAFTRPWSHQEGKQALHILSDGVRTPGCNHALKLREITVIHQLALGCP